MGSELPVGWRLVRLSDLGEVNRGRSRHRPRYAEHLYGGPYPFVQTGDIRESGGRITSHQQTYSEAGLTQSRLWPPGTMCITIAANIAETAILTYPACFPDSVVGFIADPLKANVFFIEYKFRYLKQRIQHEATGSVQDNINLATLERLTFPLPPLAEQRAIAHILGTLDDKIELNRRMNRTLEEMARAIFKSWFVDFDPVRAKAALRREHPTWIDEQVSRAACPNLKPEIAALFPDSFQDSELGEIPEGWRVRPIGEVVQVLGGGTPSTKEPAYWEGGIHPFCTPKDMASLTDPVLLQTERHLTDEGLAKVSSGQLPVGTVLLSSRAPIGYLAVAETPVTVNQGIIAMVCDAELPNLYVLHWTKANMDRVLAKANGSTFMEISKRNFRPIIAVIPPPQVLRCFMQVVDPTHQRVVSSLRQIQHLAALRDALLPKLISGEIRVKDAEKFLRERGL